MFRFIPLFVCGVLAAGSSAQAATVIVANTPNANGMGNTNTQIPSTFGDNITTGSTGVGTVFTITTENGFAGTPDIGLTWARTGTNNGGNSGNWEFHGWTNAGGGALQLDGDRVNDAFSITFTPTATTGVVLNGFNFIGDTNGNNYQFRVDVVRLSDNVVVSTQPTASWTTNTAQPNNNAPSVALNYTGDIGVAYRLDLVGLTVGNANNIAIDNLSFSQVPEPSIGLLGAIGLLGLLRRRR